jgi:hypothetical protein
MFAFLMLREGGEYHRKRKRAEFEARDAKLVKQKMSKVCVG